MCVLCVGGEGGGGLEAEWVRVVINNVPVATLFRFTVSTLTSLQQAASLFTIVPFMKRYVTGSGKR